MAWNIAEEALEAEVLNWLAPLGYATGHGEDFTPERLVDPERETWADSVLFRRLERAAERLNPGIAPDDRADAIRRALQTHHPTTIENNRAFHHLLIDGVDVPWRDEYGNPRHRKLRLIDLDNVESNEWLAIQQCSIEEKPNHRRRPDVMLFVNGIPLVVIELKQPIEGNMVSAWNQLQTYIHDLPNLMRTNLALVASNGYEARVGSITAGILRFALAFADTGRSMLTSGRPRALASAMIEMSLRPTVLGLPVAYSRMKS